MKGRLAALQECSIRSAQPGDLAPARELLHRVAISGGCTTRLTDLLAVACGSGSEYRASIAECDAELQGVAVYGSVAGTVSTAAVYGCAVPPGSEWDETAATLLRSVCDDLRASGSRLVIAERRGDCVTELERLIENGFELESTIADYHADGVPLMQLRVEL